MKKKVLILILACAVVATVVALYKLHSVADQQEAARNNNQHMYATWDTMEFDKCVSAWLITRFLDKDARFVFYPQGTEITKEIPFDVPGANWSRKHRQCTSQCILETIKLKDPAAEHIVAIAGQVELNFWQLDNMPEARQGFDDIRKIMDDTPDRENCFEKAGKYFDDLYSQYKEK